METIGKCYDFNGNFGFMIAKLTQKITWTVDGEYDKLVVMALPTNKDTLW